MRLLRWSALLLVAVLWGGCSGASSHSLRYFYTSMSEPGQGLPRFVIVGYVDGQLFSQYDSDTRRETPRAPWMAKAGKEDPQYWDGQTQIGQGNEAVFRAELETMRQRYNQSAGASAHSHRSFYTAVSAPGQGLPRFVLVRYVDGQRISHYDSDTRRATPRAPWMAKAGEEHPQYWDRNTQNSRGAEATFRGNVKIAMQRYNQSAAREAQGAKGGKCSAATSPSGA